MAVGNLGHDNVGPDTTLASTRARTPGSGPESANAAPAPTPGPRRPRQLRKDAPEPALPPAIVLPPPPPSSALVAALLARALESGLNLFLQERFPDWKAPRFDQICFRFRVKRERANTERKARDEIRERHANVIHDLRSRARILAMVEAALAYARVDHTGLAEEHPLIDTIYRHFQRGALRRANFEVEGKLFSMGWGSGAYVNEKGVVPAAASKVANRIALILKESIQFEVEEALASGAIRTRPGVNLEPRYHPFR